MVSPRPVINGAGVIAPLLDVGAERGLAQHRAHLIRDGDEQIAEDLQVHCVCFGIRPRRSLRVGLLSASGRVAGAVRDLDQKDAMAFPFVPLAASRLHSLAVSRAGEISASCGNRGGAPQLRQLVALAAESSSSRRQSPIHMVIAAGSARSCRHPRFAVLRGIEPEAQDGPGPPSSATGAAATIAAVGRDQKERIARQRILRFAGGPAVLADRKTAFVESRASDARGRFLPRSPPSSLSSRIEERVADVAWRFPRRKSFPPSGITALNSRYIGQGSSAVQNMPALRSSSAQA